MKQHQTKNIFFINFILLTLLSAIFFSGLTRPSTDLLKKRKIRAMYQAYKNKDFKEVPDLSVDSLLALQKKGKKVVLVDVREKKEIKVSTIPGAISQKKFEKNIRKYRDYQIVVYCTIGYRSGIYTEKLRRKNLKAYNLIGGVLDWAHAGQKFSNPSGDSLKVHVYGQEWNLAPEGYQPVW